MTEGRSIVKSFDWGIIGLYLTLVIIGWFNLYGAIYDYEQTNIFSFSNQAGKQFIWIVSAFGIALLLSLVEAKYYSILAYLLYGITVLILLITPLIAHETKGSLSWISFGSSFKLQPAEIAKITTALALSKYMGSYGYKVRSLRDMIVPLLLLLTPMLIIMVPQKETGSALVFVSFFIMFYREGMNGNILLVGLAAILFFIFTIAWGSTPLPFATQSSVGLLLCMLIVIAVQLIYTNRLSKRGKTVLPLLIGYIVIYTAAITTAFFVNYNFNIVCVGSVALGCIYTGYLALSTYKHDFWILTLFAALSIAYVFSCDYIFNHVMRPHQRDRIMVTLNLKEDLSGVGYNVNQSKIAIGSGGFQGKGYLNGTQTKLKYVPENDTDFIFTTVGEEFGFVGSTIVLLLFLWFILRIIKAAERQKDAFNRIYGYCVAGIFSFHLAINIGMVIGLVPVIGIPLPFFSYGGSSFWAFTILLFIFLRLDASRAESY